MRKSRRPIVIASRRSLLARAQAQAVGRALGRLHPQIAVEFRWIESEGDRRHDVPLTDSGLKGFFTRAVELELLKGRADLAIHSLKDLPTQLTPGLAIAAIPQRGDPRDCFISSVADSIEQLPQGAGVGTSSPRRAAQLLRLRPDLSVSILRGNVETRLRKILEERQFDATLLAMAGLQRAGLAQYAVKPVDPGTILPASSQAALAIQCRTDDHLSMTRCLPLNDTATSAAVHFERTVVAGLNGTCQSPIAVFAEPVSAEARVFRVRARVLSLEGGTCLEAEDQVSAAELSRAADRMIAKLEGLGSAAVLRLAATPRAAVHG